jgi:hypothetical protein
MSRSLRAIAARCMLLGSVLGFHLCLLGAIIILFRPMEILVTVFSCIAVIVLCVLLALEVSRPNSDSAAGKRSPKSIAVRSLALGSALGFHLGLAGLSLFLLETSWRWVVIEWSLFVIALCVFHSLEFLWASTFEPATVTSDAFLLNHSAAYIGSLVFATIEFWLETLLVPSWKFHAAANVTMLSAGIILVACGQGVRTWGMFTAQGNFTHLVARQKRASHQLVRHGVYSVLRHPSYFGQCDYSHSHASSCSRCTHSNAAVVT